MSKQNSSDSHIKNLFEQQRKRDQHTAPKFATVLGSNPPRVLPNRRSHLKYGMLLAAAASVSGLAWAWAFGLFSSNQSQHDEADGRSTLNAAAQQIRTPTTTDSVGEPDQRATLMSNDDVPLPALADTETTRAGKEPRTRAIESSPERIAESRSVVGDRPDAGIHATLQSVTPLELEPSGIEETELLASQVAINALHRPVGKKKSDSRPSMVQKGVQPPHPLTECVKVVATQPVMDLEKSSAGVAFSKEFAQDLPTPGRHYQNVLTLSPGANDTDSGGSPADPSTRSRDFRAVVTGVSGVDPLTGQMMSSVNPNSIEELQVVSSGAAVEFGQTQGGFAAVARQPVLPAEQASVTPVPSAPAPRIVREQERDLPGANNEEYAPIYENDFLNVSSDPLSTFSIDVDTASYSNVRRMLNQGIRVPSDAVRIEELINYFEYDYPQPTGKHPFAVDLELGSCPWNPEHLLAKIGLQAEATSRSETAGSNLVFLLDVSGSMNAANKLPLLKQALAEMFIKLNSRDRVAIVVYAGASGLVLDSTSGSEFKTLRRAIQELSAGGSTAGAEGITLAYQVARENFIEGGVNRVILATDGDFNVGATSHSDLFDLIEKDAENGIFLTALGFGMGNYKDGRLEQLADRGNGNYAYIDSIQEARKVLVDELEGTLYTVAKDVKIQVEFNPQQVAGYRLIGYENRALANADFADDQKDAGELGSGHSVTALYEIVPTGQAVPRAATEKMIYQQPAELTRAADSGEWMTVKLRYKKPDGKKSRLLTRALTGEPAQLGGASADFDHAASVAAFGMLLRGSAHAGAIDTDLIRELARSGASRDAHGYRAQFLELVELVDERRLGRLSH